MLISLGSAAKEVRNPLFKSRSPSQLRATKWILEKKVSSFLPITLIKLLSSWIRTRPSNPAMVQWMERLLASQDDLDSIPATIKCFSLLRNRVVGMKQNHFQALDVAGKLPVTLQRPRYSSIAPVLQLASEKLQRQRYKTMALSHWQVPLCTQRRYRIAHWQVASKKPQRRRYSSIARALQHHWQLASDILCLIFKQD